MSAPEPQAVVAAGTTSGLADILEAQRELLARATDPQAVYAYGAELVCRITRCESAAIYGQEGDAFVRRGAFGTERELDSPPRYAHSLVGECFRSGAMRISGDMQNDPRADQDGARQLGLRAAVLAPLTSARGIEGVMRAGSTRVDAFCVEDSQVLGILGGIIGTALEVGALFQRAQQQTDEVWSALEQASRSEQDQRLLFDQNPTPMFIFDPHSLEFLRANTAALALYGFAQDEFVGQSALLICPVEDRPRLAKAIAAAGEGTHTGKWRHLRKDGRELDVNAVSHAFNLDGRAVRLVIVNDETERLRAEATLAATQQQLMQADKMSSVGQLAAGVAHEINNPIGYVYSNLGSLGKYLEDLLGLLDLYGSAEAAIPAGHPALTSLAARKAQIDLPFLREDLKALMGESREGITRVKKIVQDLKDFSHADVRDDWQVADLHKGLESTLNIAHNELKYTCTVVKDFGELPPVRCLPSQLNQVFLNLLVNAAHAIKEKGTVTLRTRLCGGEAWIEVSDTGSGIPKENLKRIFDPFFTTKPIGKGTGLGLSLSYGIVQKHGGRIEVESEPGRGTTFRVRLPAPAEAAADADAN